MLLEEEGVAVGSTSNVLPFPWSLSLYPPLPPFLPSPSLRTLYLLLPIPVMRPLIFEAKLFSRFRYQ